MIFVNVPGAPVWPQLQHSAWNGLTVADVVFPAFLLAVGASLALSKPPTTLRATRRVVVLVALGLLVNRATFDGPWRLPGILQRIAVCYLVAVIIVRLPRRFVLAAAIVLLAAYGAVLRLGGMTADRSLPGAVDLAVFGQTHLYHQNRYDPEGLVGSVAATATVLIGFLALRWLRSQPPSLPTVALLGAAAASLTAAGLVLSLTQPVNKRMWTPSFTLVTAGLGLVVLALLYVLVEVLRWRPVAFPFAVLGANALALYALSELGDAGLRHIITAEGACGRPSCPTVNGHDWIYQHWFAATVGARVGSLLFSAAVLCVLCLIAGLLWRAKWFLRV